ncbi:hypothetical protein, partial [Mesorhizobium sp. M7A.F.Ca.CA.001.09.2.1]
MIAAFNFFDIHRRLIRDTQPTAKGAATMAKGQSFGWSLCSDATKSTVTNEKRRPLGGVSALRRETRIT